LLKTFWIKIFPCFNKQARGESFLDPWGLIPHLKKGKQGKTGHLSRGFSFYLGISRWRETLVGEGVPLSLAPSTSTCG
jgi:hypothetical protein